MEIFTLIELLDYGCMINSLYFTRILYVTCKAHYIILFKWMRLHSPIGHALQMSSVTKKSLLQVLKKQILSAS